LSSLASPLARRALPHPFQLFHRWLPFKLTELWSVPAQNSAHPGRGAG
jgi:hypothetical protein